MKQSDIATMRKIINSDEYASIFLTVDEEGVINGGLHTKSREALLDLISDTCFLFADKLLGDGLDPFKIIGVIIWRAMEGIHKATRAQFFPKKEEGDNDGDSRL